MANPNDVATDIGGLEPNPNELNAAGAPLSVAKNVIINRDGMVETRRGFFDFSTNLPPNTTPDQLFESGGVLYSNIDGGLWYYSATASGWIRKGGDISGSLNTINAVVEDTNSNKLYLFSSRFVVCSLDLTTGQMLLLAGRFNVSQIVDGAGDVGRMTGSAAAWLDQANGVIYFTDQFRLVRSFTIATNTFALVAGNAAVTGNADGTGAAATFNAPSGIWGDGAGNLYVCDQGSNIIRRVTTAGVVTTIAGTAGAGAFADGTGAVARFNTPIGISGDGSGNLLVCDRQNSVIRKLSPPLTVGAAVVTTVAGTAGASANTDGTGAAARFIAPWGINLCGTTFIISQQSQHNLRAMTSSFSVTSTVGLAGTSGSVDGIGINARSNNPWFAAGSANRFWFGDANGLRVVYPTANYLTGTAIGGGTILKITPEYIVADGILIGPS